jgi:steroid delta-isomerase-like uncharacterized protein
MTTASDLAYATPGPVEVVRGLFEALNQRDLDALYDYWAEKLVAYWPFGTHRGRAEVRAYFAELFSAVPDCRIHVENIAGEGDTVFVRWRMTGTATGTPWRGIECNGSRLDMQGVDCFTVRDGMIEQNIIFFDQLNFARHIGLMPPENSLIDRMMVKGYNARTRLKKRLGLAQAEGDCSSDSNGSRG